MSETLQSLKKTENKHHIHLILVTAFLVFCIMITRHNDRIADILCLILLILHAIYQFHIFQICHVLQDIAKEKDCSPAELDYLKFAYRTGLSKRFRKERYCWIGSTTMKQMFTYYTKTANLVLEYTQNLLPFRRLLLRFCLYRLTKDDVISSVRTVRHHLYHLPSYQKK